jgi:energy-coupling factor transporter ATP-binding protein EcfA2
VRLTRIEFNGYKRLASTACNVDGRLIAVLGPNEAGKSSVLEALAWLSDRDSGELAGRLRSRSLGPLPEDKHVVTVRYALDDDDRAALAGLDTGVVPHTYRYVKTAAGDYQADTEPRVTRRRTALVAAAQALTGLFGENDAGGKELPLDESKGGPGGDLMTAVNAMETPDQAPDADVVAAFDGLSAWLRNPGGSDQQDTDGQAGPDEPNSQQAAYNDAADLVDAALAKLQEPDVAAQSRRILGERRPDFLLFQEPDRVLDSTYSLADATVQPPPALRNLLKIAGTSFEELATTRDSGDTSRIQSLLKRSNRQLAERLEPTWRQSKLAVQIDISGDLLQILVEEITPDGAVTDIAERSDGLRTFIALVCFLAEKETDTEIPPVLMIDEAETHLHYDAQADLLDVLLNDVKTSSVIYTTHSPGCLPPDLGTGIRLVAPDPNNRAVSTLKAEFWHNKQPGFSPLLFAMGASAAAFSVCRRAVLAEGASDMILLPSLLRAATGETDLGYQVAPGLAMGTADLSDADIAARVVYLADGDSAGERYKTELVEQGVDADRVHLLPAGKAIEDLLTEQSWFAAVHALMTEAGYTGPPLTANDLPGDGPIAKRLKDWGKTSGWQPPGKAIVASHLVQDPKRITLTPQAEKALRELHKRFTAELARPASSVGYAD